MKTFEIDLRVDSQTELTVHLNRIGQKIEQYGFILTPLVVRPLFRLLLVLTILLATLTGCNKRSAISEVAIVRGGSMAPYLLGLHHDVECSDCGFGFPVDADKVPSHGRAACPNCGNKKIRIEILEVRNATEVEVAIGKKEINRWDVIAFFDPTGRQYSHDKKMVKRAIGLPNDDLEFKDGDIWVNGEIAHRSFDVQTDMMILVHDSRYLQNERSHFWQKKNDATEQREQETLFQFQPRKCYRQSGQQESKFVEDSYGYNQAVRRSQMNFVDQLLVEVDMDFLDSSEKAELELVIKLVEDIPVKFKLTQFSAMVEDFSGKVTASVWSPPSGSFRVAFSNFDDQLRISIDGKVIVEAACPQAPDVQESASKYEFPVTMSATRTDATEDFKFGQFKIYRDVYYFVASESSFPSRIRLGDDEYFVLGDNCPVSRDSRSWKSPMLNQDKIIGVVSKKD